MLQESVLSKHASCPPSVLCSAARCACHHRAHQLHGTTNRARTYARAQSKHLSELTSLSFLQAQFSACASALASVLCHPRARRHHRPAQAAWDPGPPSCSKFSLEGFMITSLGPLVVAMRVMWQQLLEYCARPLPRAPWVVPDGSHRRQ